MKVLIHQLAALEESDRSWRNKHIPKTQAQQSVGVSKEYEKGDRANRRNGPFRIINAFYERSPYLPLEYPIGMQLLRIIHAHALHMVWLLQLSVETMTQFHLHEHWCPRVSVKGYLIWSVEINIAVMGTAPQTHCPPLPPSSNRFAGGVVGRILGPTLAERALFELQASLGYFFRQ